MTSFGLRSGLRPGQMTSKLLEKASKQLRGGYGGKATGASDSDLNGEDDDDGISSYLKLLNEKTAHQAEKTGTNNGGEISDEELKANEAKSAAATISTNRFLKKPSTPTAVDKQSSTVGLAKTEQSKASGKAVEKSPTLHKVEAFTKKYARGSKISELEPASDSDLDLSLSMDEDVLADVKELKKIRPASSFDSGASLRSEAKLSRTKPKKSENSSEADSGSMKIGGGANRFLKTPVAVPDLKSPEAASQQKERPESSAKERQRAPSFRLESAKRHSTEVVLDTDEESLAEYIGGLSGSSSGRRTPSNTKSKESTKSGLRVKLMTSEIGDRFDNNVDEVEPDSYKFNLRDLESSLDMTKATDMQNKSVTPQQKKEIGQFRSSKAREVKERSVSREPRKERADDDILSQFGLQTVDELLGMAKDDDDDVEPMPISEVQYESDFDFAPSTSRGISPMPLRSILSPTPKSMTPKSSRSRVRLMDELTEIRSRSPSPETPKSASRASGLTRSETVRTVTDSESEAERTIRTINESQTKGSTSGGSDTEETSTVKTFSDGDSVSSFDRMSATRRSKRRIQRRSSSSRRSSTASERYYSDDFTTTSPGSESQSTSRRSSYTDDIESQGSTSVSTYSKDRSKRITRKVNTKESEVQTGLDVGLHYHWVNDMAHEAWASAQYRQAFADPTNIATSVVSSKALDALTNFNPANLALNDLLRQQLQLTTQFMTVHRRLHYSLIQSLDSSAFKYTTLKETKEFIRKHSRPVASFEETLQQVKQEMGIV